MSVELNPLNRGVIIYPLEYVANECQEGTEEWSHYIHCKTQGGKEVIAFIVPDEIHKQNARRNSAATVPTVYDFTRKRPKNPCVSDKDNCSDSPRGIMMLEQVSIAPELSKSFGKMVLVAKWLSVIAEDYEEIPAFIGKGYLEINVAGKPTGEILALEKEYRDINSEIKKGNANLMDHSERLEYLYKQIVSKTKKVFTAVLIEYHKTYALKSADIDNFKNLLKRCLLSNTKNGMYGGCIVRVRNDKNVDIGNTYICNHKYNYAERKVEDIDVVINDFIKYGGSKALRAGFSNGNTIEIIPTVRINCAFNGNDKFSKEIVDSPLGMSKTLKTYVEPKFREDPLMPFSKVKSYSFSDIACRVSLLEEPKHRGNIILSTIHSFSAPKGNFLSINNKGFSEYTVYRN